MNGPLRIYRKKDLTTKGRIFKRPKFQKAEKLIGLKTHYRLNKWPNNGCGVDLRSRLARLGPSAPIFRPYFLILTIIGLFECEKRYLCSLFLSFYENSALIFSLFGFFSAFYVSAPIYRVNFFISENGFLHVL